MRYRLPHALTSKTAQFWLAGTVVVLLIAVNGVMMLRATNSAATVGTSSPTKTAHTSATPAQKAETTASTEPMTNPSTGVGATQTTPQTSTAPAAAPVPKPAPTPTAPPIAPPAPAPLPFGMYSISVSGMYACLGGETSYFHISDANLIFKGTAGGTVKYWLESSGLTGLGSASGVRTVSVPAGRSVGSLWQLSGASGPPTLYAFAISPEQGEGSVRLVVQAGSDTQYSTVNAIPASSSC